MHCRFVKQKIKSSLHWRYSAEACNEWRDPSPQLSAWTTQLRRNVAAVASIWRLCVRFEPGIESKTVCFDSDVCNRYTNLPVLQSNHSAQQQVWSSFNCWKKMSVNLGVGQHVIVLQLLTAHFILAGRVGWLKTKQTQIIDED